MLIKFCKGYINEISETQTGPRRVVKSRHLFCLKILLSAKGCKIKGPLGCLVSVKKRLKYTLLNSYYKSKCFARPQKACMLFTLAIFTGSSLKTFAPLKK